MDSSLRQDQASHSVLPLVSLNHVSFLCSSLQRSVKFYQEVLGFLLTQRPSSLGFQGAWLYNYGVGIHLLQRGPDQADQVPPKPPEIDPRGNHISFQCGDVGAVRMRLDGMGIEYVTAVLRSEGGIGVNQLFFHDPDHNMIEICECQKIPVVPLLSSSSALLLASTPPPPPNCNDELPKVQEKPELSCSYVTLVQFSDDNRWRILH